MESSLHNPEYIKRLIAETAFSSDGAERILRLYDILDSIAEDEFLSQHLALKGGTALNLFVFPGLPRISEDLDFDLCGRGVIEKDDALSVLNSEALPRLNEILAKKGYVPQESARKRYGLHALSLPYETNTRGRARIKMDINYLDRVHLFKPKKRETAIPGIDLSVSAITLSLSEILAGKLCALLDRTKPRDVFDIATLSDYPLSEERMNSVHKAFIFYAALNGFSAEQIPLAVNRIKEVSIFDYKREIFPMLKTHLGFFDAAQYNERATALAASLVTPVKTSEVKYLNLYAQGCFRPDILYPDKDTERLSLHPKAKADMLKLHRQQLSVPASKLR